jgi:UDP-N-acetylmuramoyl-L-alanine---L-glutamate ligase
MPSRPELGWGDLPGLRVGLWGIGTEARASRRRLQAMGVTPVLVDDRPPADPGDLGPVLATDAGGLDALLACDVVVKTPGISRHRPEVRALEAAGVRVTSGLALWLWDADRSRVVCVTGTKGKSTTVSILGHLARGLGLDVFVGGNLGTPPFDPDAPDDADLWVVETSSYQATDLAVTPPVVAVTSLSPDHLPWHGDVEAYYRDKLSLTSQPGAEVALVNGDDPVLREHADLLGPGPQWVTAPDEPPAWVAALGLPGRHNVTNALIAQRCLVALGVDGADDPARLAAAGAGFDGLASRLQTVAEVDGVAFVDDSLSTNVLSTIAALDAFPGRAVALLAGGEDRGIAYDALGAHLVARAARNEETLLVALPSTGPKIVAAAAAAAGAPGAGAGPGAAGRLEVVEVTSDEPGAVWLPDAVAQAFAWARPRGGVVLLSPAAASFDRFGDYRDRARVFTEAAGALRD